MTLDTMDHFHSNYGEIRQLFDKWASVWGAGGPASLHLHTLEGMARAMLDPQLGHPSAPRPGAPDVRQGGASGAADQLLSGATRQGARRGGTGSKRPGHLQPRTPSL